MPPPEEEVVERVESVEVVNSEAMEKTELNEEEDFDQQYE